LSTITKLGIHMFHAQNESSVYLAIKNTDTIAN